jgi:hypothetical protein
MMTLVKQAIDTSILAFKSKRIEQRSTENEIEPTVLFTRTQAASSSGCPRPEQRNTVQDHLHASNGSSLQSVGESLDSMPDLRRQISTSSTLDSDSIPKEVNQSESTVEGVALNLDQLAGDHPVEASGQGEGIAHISVSAKGKQKAVHPQNESNESNDGQEFSTDVDLPRDFTYPDDHFGHIGFQQDMNLNFEDMSLDSEWESGFDWLDRCQ